MIGKWTCYGSFVGNGGATAEGVWLYSTQVYEFDVEQIETTCSRRASMP